MYLPHSKAKPRSNEEIFFEFYPRLLEWASQLVHHDRAEAEDLVHDLYIQFVRITRPVEGMERIEGYLFTILRNLHYSRMRRAGHDPINHFSIVDYDSVELGLAAVDRRQLLFVRENLKQICRYACQRKATARSASILILRFFFGYYPSEVMKVTQTSRMAVDRSLQVARREARLDVERPNAIRCIAPGNEIPVSFAGESLDSENLFVQLREAIFSACEGEHFGPGVLEKRYAPGSQAGFTTPELAHLVSCRTCLDRANVILGLPLLSERSPEDALGHDTHSGPGTGAGPTGVTGGTGKQSPGAKKTRQRQRLERRVRQLFEHRPASLQIAVNGEIRASQIVTSEVSELYLKLGRPEVPSFIEVLSEQGLCIVYLPVEEPTYSSGMSQTQEVILSDDRSLVLSLSFAADVPIVHVIYRDPILSESLARVEDAEHGSMKVLESENSVPSVKAFPIDARAGNKVRRLMVKSLSWLGSRLKALVYPDMNPLVVSGAILAVASVVCFSVWLWGPPRITPTALLQRATTSENATVTGATGVIRQRVSIRTPKRKLERSIYRDATGQRRAKQQPLDSDTAQLRTELTANGVSWEQPLSAATYQNWHDHAQVQSDAVERPGNGLLKLTTTVANSDVVQESLTVRADDFHPVERTISFRDEGTVEIAELDYAVLPWSAVDPALFEPLGGLSSGRPNGSGEMHPSLLHSMNLPLTEGEVDQAELSTLLVLHELHADADGRIQIVRRPNGIQVKGIVENEGRKQEVETALYRVPHVIPSIFTYQELQNHADPVTQITSVQTASGEAEPSPLEKYLLVKGIPKDYLSKLSGQLSESSSEIRQDSIAIDGLSRRFMADQQLTDSARATFDQLIAQRKQSILDALEEEQRSLAQAGLNATITNTPSLDGTELAEAAERNRRLCEELISGGGTQPRSAQDILPELLQAITQIRLASHQVMAVSAPHPSPSQKP